MEGVEGEHVVTLQDSENAYRILVEKINDGVATLDSAGTVLYANNRFLDMLGVASGKFVGAPLEEHISSSDRENLRTLISEGVHDSVQAEITLDVAKGRPRLVRLALYPMKAADKENICVVATELTELMEANQALKSNEESLRLLSARLLNLQDEERRHIARDLHDITGQKLAAQSMALAQVLKGETGLTAESRKTLAECVSLNKQVGTEIRTLSYLLHPPLLDELGLSSAVKWYAEGFEQKTGIHIEVDIDANLRRLPPNVEVALFRVIQESLTNVHRYSGSLKGFVRVKSKRGEIEVQIGDYGRGMDRDTLGRAAGKGAPLGVGIQGMKERMRLLAGKLAVTSEVNKGTRVTATLPLSDLNFAESSATASGTGTERSVASQEDGRTPRNLSKKQILIVDDHELLRQGIRTMLQKETDLEVCGEAMDGQEAIDKTIALSPDLLILDINLPVLNGLAAVRQILRHRPQTKILIFTVHDSEQTQKEIRAAGAHGYLSKGKGGDDLLRVVRSLLAAKTSSFSAASNVGK
ncbi:MAG: response regulator [Candidatus Acidiferrum sp.]